MKKRLLSGEIRFFPLEDLFQVLNSNKSTGILHLKNRHVQENATVYFKDGEIVHASYGPLTGLDAVYPLFGWSEGEFSFLNEPFERQRTINKKMMEIVLDGLRKVDEGEVHKDSYLSYETSEGDVEGEPSVTLPVLRGPLIDFEYVVEIDDVPKGHDIVREGGYGDWLWVVLKGSAHIVRKTERGPLTILKITEGSFIGSMRSFLFQDNVRSATVKAYDTMELGALDLQRLSQDFVSMSQELRQLLISYDHRLREVSDRVVEFYSGKDDLDKALRQKKRIDPMENGEDGLFFIEKGSAVEINKTDHGPVMLSRLGPGDFVGIPPFHSSLDDPFHPVVFGSKDMELKPLNRKVLQAEYERIPNTFKNMVDFLTNCISVTTKTACDFHRRMVGVSPSGSKKPS